MIESFSLYFFSHVNSKITLPQPQACACWRLLFHVDHQAALLFHVPRARSLSIVFSVYTSQIWFIVFSYWLWIISSTGSMNTIYIGRVQCILLTKKIWAPNPVSLFSKAWIWQTWPLWLHYSPAVKHGVQFLRHWKRWLIASCPNTFMKQWHFPEFYQNLAKFYKGIL